MFAQRAKTSAVCGIVLAAFVLLGQSRPAAGHDESPRALMTNMDYLLARVCPFCGGRLSNIGICLRCNQDVNDWDPDNDSKRETPAGGVQALNRLLADLGQYLRGQQGETEDWDARLRRAEEERIRIQEESERKDRARKASRAAAHVAAARERAESDAWYEARMRELDESMPDSEDPFEQLKKSTMAIEIEIERVNRFAHGDNQPLPDRPWGGTDSAGRTTPLPAPAVPPAPRPCDAQTFVDRHRFWPHYSDELKRCQPDPRRFPFKSNADAATVDPFEQLKRATEALEMENRKLKDAIHRYELNRN